MVRLFITILIIKKNQQKKRKKTFFGCFKLEAAAALAIVINSLFLLCNEEIGNERVCVGGYEGNVLMGSTNFV